MASDDLAGIDIRSGVNGEGVGFCHVLARTGDGRLIIGQLEPNEVREMALAWLAAAEAAETDAAVVRCIRKLKLPEELAGAIVTELRDSRSE